MEATMNPGADKTPRPVQQDSTEAKWRQLEERYGSPRNPDEFDRWGTASDVDSDMDSV